MTYESHNERQARRRILLNDVRETAELILEFDAVPEARREFAQRRIATRLRYAAEGLERLGLKRFAARALEMSRRFSEGNGPHFART